MSDHDVIIIGSGFGGLICGALLAKMAGKRVLVLERNGDIGGKIMSYGYLHDPDITEDQYKASLAACGHSKVVYSDPDFSTIVEKHGLFKKYIVDTGWHQMSVGPRIINNVPPRHLGRVLPERYWPLDFRRCRGRRPQCHPARPSI
jgi:ribulose 1,5-bisphosphate synthetase/thiazole synthase